MRLIKILLLLQLIISLSSCGPLAYKKVDARKVSWDPNERVKQNIEEGKSFRLFDTKNLGGTTSYEFASSNELWRATLDTLNFMPLVSANYSGGIVITDWYSENSPTESIKITVRFLTNEIRSDALEVKVFVKECSQNLNSCNINQKNNTLVSELKLNILKKASRYDKERKEKYKKENPYVLSVPDNKRSNKAKKD